MEKSIYNEIVTELTALKAFLDECDEGLADEIGMRDKIAGRIYRTANELPNVIADARAKAK